MGDVLSLIKYGFDFYFSSFLGGIGYHGIPAFREGSQWEKNNETELYGSMQSGHASLWGRSG